MDRKWKGIIWVLIVLWVVVILGMGVAITIGHAQVTPGSVFSKTEDGVGNKITSTVVGATRGLDVSIIAGGSSGPTYLDADGIVNQTASAVHGQTYMYNGATWDRMRGDTTNGVWVNCKSGCAAASGTVADAGNSTLVALGVGGNFTGAAFDLTNYASWSISVFSNVGSAANGLTIEWSEDNVNWGAADVVTYISGSTNMAGFGHKSKYVRLNYTNGGVGQATFRVYAWAHPFVRETRRFVGTSLSDTDTGQIVVASLQGHSTAGGGAWVPVKVNPSGAITADVTQSTSPWVVSGTVGVSNAFLLDATFTGRWAAASLDADAIANETTTSVHGKCYLYNGATWDRCRGAVSTGLLVNVSNASLAVTQSGTWNIGTVTTLTSITNSVAVTNAGLTNIDVALSTRLADTTFTGRFVAATLDADTIANQTTTSMHGMCYMYNGTTWDRCRGAAATGLLVNISNASIAVTGSLGRSWTLSSGTDSVAATVSNAFLLDATFTGRINTLGQKAMAASTPVVLASDQASIPVTIASGTVTAVTSITNPVSILSTVASANNAGACTSGAANFTVVASNASRTWLAIWASPANTDDVYIKLGVTATNANARISPGQPINFVTGRIYTGQIDAFPNSGTQTVCLMELN